MRQGCFISRKNIFLSFYLFAYKKKCTFANNYRPKKTNLMKKLYLFFLGIFVSLHASAQMRGYDYLGTLCQISIFMDEIDKTNDLVFKIPLPDHYIGIYYALYGPGQPHVLINGSTCELHLRGPILKTDIEASDSYVIPIEWYVGRWFNTRTFQYIDSREYPNGDYWIPCYYEIQLMKDKLY